MPPVTSAKTRYILLGALWALVVCFALALGAPRALAMQEAIDNSDLNGDEVVDLVDLHIFSTKYLELQVEEVDWCAFYEAVSLEERYEGKLTKYYQKHFRLLLGFIYDEFDCDGGALLLGVVNEPRSLGRIALDSDYTGNFYITDARVGSVFIYDAAWTLVGELKNLEKPLGVAIDSQGYLLVGSDARDDIEVYDPATGDYLGAFGVGLVQMPTAITIGPDDEIYVTDSRANRVWVFEFTYVHLRTIGSPGAGDGQLKFPTDTAVITADVGGSPTDEVYVADQGNRRIKVFGTDGQYLRAIDPPLVLSVWCLEFGFSCPDDARGTFNRLQALHVDGLGRLHSLDIFEAAVTALDPATGEIEASYGGWGSGEGLMRVPLDVLVTPLDEAVVTDSGTAELEIFANPPSG